jgi:hypothetical protein
MTAEVRKQGDYELFETARGHRVLALNGREWYAWITGQESPILVKSDSDHEKERTVATGRFYLIDVEDDPDFTDMPHLFLEERGEYRELILPNGLPTEDDHQKRLVETDETVSPDRIARIAA